MAKLEFELEVGTETGLELELELELELVVGTETGLELELELVVGIGSALGMLTECVLEAKVDVVGAGSSACFTALLGLCAPATGIIGIGTGI